MENHCIEYSCCLYYPWSSQAFFFIVGLAPRECKDDLNVDISKSEQKVVTVYISISDLLCLERSYKAIAGRAGSNTAPDPDCHEPALVLVGPYCPSYTKTQAVLSLSLWIGFNNDFHPQEP